MMYIKKPIPVEARILKHGGGRPFEDEGAEWKTRDISNSDGRYDLKTLEGWYTVNFGDYIIKGVRGEFYPCRRDIFEETYTLVI